MALCFCGAVATERTVKKDNSNKGRVFLCCSKNLGDPTKCRFFQWADEDKNASPAAAAAVRAVPSRTVHVSLELVSCDEFAVSSQSSAVPEQARSLVGRRFPRDQLSSVQRQLTSIPHVVVRLVLFFFFFFFRGSSFLLSSCPPAQVLQAIHEAPKLVDVQEKRRADIAKRVESEIPIFGKLYKFQQSGVVQMIERGGRAFLCDEMGLGKTVQSICVVRFLNRFPLLIVCPKSLRSNWCNELVQWGLVESEEDEVQKIATAKDKLRKRAKVTQKKMRKHGFLI
jgi:hypothetical protein